LAVRISSKSLFVGGLAAGAVGVAISLILRLSTGGLFIPEVASLTLFSLTPGEVESQAVQTLGPLAKLASFVGSVVVSIILHGLIGILLGRFFYNRLRWKGYFGKAVQSSIVSYFILLAVTIVLLTLTEATAGPLSLSDVFLYLIPPNIVFGFIFPLLFQKIPMHMPSISKITHKRETADDSGRKAGREPSSAKEEYRLSRRVFLRSAAASVFAIPVLFYGTNRLLFPTQQQTGQPVVPVTPPSQLGPTPAGFGNPSLSPLLQYEVTPTELFYRIDITPVIPNIDAETWTLSVKGLVDTPSEINYEQLRAMPSVEQSATLSCISNKIGGDLISNAMWKGVPLKSLLDQAGIRPGAEYIVFRCFDGYDVGIPLEKGFEDGTILAYEMNGATLNAAHGFPVRAIVPDIYGMMNAKWITEIEIVDYVYEGFWQRKGWSNTAVVNTLSSTVVPGNAPLRTRFRGFLPAGASITSSNNNNTSSTSPGRRASVGGIAFAGTRGVSKVQVSIDNGVTWIDASIKEPLSPYSWVLWAAELSLPNGGSQQQQQNVRLRVRATDKAGNVQTSEIREPFPDGSTGYHIINIEA
jgi:DMSO/TMAO reductase YedYZ molybdopterin-dependent catalytic subunit